MEDQILTFGTLRWVYLRNHNTFCRYRYPL